jgi:hypothetical protein
MKNLITLMQITAIMIFSAAHSVSIARAQGPTEAVVASGQYIAKLVRGGATAAEQKGVLFLVNKALRSEGILKTALTLDTLEAGLKGVSAKQQASILSKIAEMNPEVFAKLENKALLTDAQKLLNKNFASSSKVQTALKTKTPASGYKINVDEVTAINKAFKGDVRFAESHIIIERETGLKYFSKDTCPLDAQAKGNLLPLVKKQEALAVSIGKRVAGNQKQSCMINRGVMNVAQALQALNNPVAEIPDMIKAACVDCDTCPVEFAAASDNIIVSENGKARLKTVEEMGGCPVGI